MIRIFILRSISLLLSTLPVHVILAAHHNVFYSEPRLSYVFELGFWQSYMLMLAREWESSILSEYMKWFPTCCFRPRYIIV